MVLKSKKSKSKRTTLSKKYKIIKKVKAHLKKKAKQDKGKQHKAPKDPGIPAQWPFKEELLKDLEWQRQRILAQEKDKKASNKLKRAAERGAGEEEGDGDEAMGEGKTAEELQREAAEKDKVFKAKKKARLEKPNAATDKDGSRRAYYKEFVKVVAAADVIIEVLDARDPLGSRCQDVERFVRQAGSDKKVILLLNKIVPGDEDMHINLICSLVADLVPKEVAEAWLKYLRQELPTLAFRCSTQKQAVNLKQGRERAPKVGRGRGGREKGLASLAMQGSDALGADTLLQLLKNYTRNSSIKTAITVGIVGLPNVGKSSLINSLKRARVAQVGNAPGVTKHVQEVSLDKHINLLDSPGMVFSASQPGDSWAALRNCIKVEQLSAPETIVPEILKRCPAKQLMALYKVPAFKDSDDFLQHVAFQRGRLLPGGIGDSKSAARVVLHDWHNGKIAYYTMPPRRGDGTHEEAAIVQAWGEAFNAERVFANESSAVIAGLSSLEDEGAAFFASETAGAAPSLETLQADLGKQGAAERDSDSDSESEAEAEEDDSEGGAPLRGIQPSKSNKGQVRRADAAAKAAQADKLYSEKGQFNPQAARADKKKLKRQKKVSLGDDFNFAEAFADEVGLGDDEEGGDGMSEGDEVPT